MTTALVNFLWRSRATTATLFPLTAASSLDPPPADYHRKEATFHLITEIGRGAEVASRASLCDLRVWGNAERDHEAGDPHTDVKGA